MTHLLNSDLSAGYHYPSSEQSLGTHMSGFKTISHSKDF